jgi:hypothetical protein
MPRSNKFLFVCIALVAILACNVPAGQTPTTPPDFVSTITAQALLIQPANNLLSPIVITATPDLSIPIINTETPTVTLTPTSGAATVTVSADTNCRSGPGKEYDNLGALLKNETAEIVGKNTVTKYWIIKNPDRDGTCWLWDRYATVSGNTDAVKEVAIPPTPTPSLPGTIKGLSANKICFFNGISYDLAGSIRWEDVSNEDGYNIFSNAGHSSVNPRDVTTSAIPNFQLNPGGSITLFVEAYNSAGKSPTISIIITCP